MLLLMSVAWLLAQEGSPGRDVWIPVNTYPPTVRGCLQDSSLRYMVAARDGTVYKLAGDTARLRPYVGHEVEISGNPTVRSFSTTMYSIASTVQKLPALDVKHVKELSKTCN
jgi:hypothetical protein